MGRQQRVLTLTPEQISNLQNKKIKQLMAQIPFHPHYKKLFNDKGIDPRKIKTTKDLERLPLTSKHDLAPTKEDPKKPQKFILQPSESGIKRHYPKWKLILHMLTGQLKKRIKLEYYPVHFHFTTGRTSNAVPIAYTAHDLKILEEAGTRLFDMFKISDDAIAINAFPYAPHLAFWQAFYAIREKNIRALQTGGGKILGTVKILDALQNMQATVLVAMPGYAYHLIASAVDQKRNLEYLDTIIFGGERIPPGLIKKMKAMLAKVNCKDPKILGTYAFTEGKVAWGECCEGSGYHLNPDFEYFEVVDEEGRRLPNGERGEIVYTGLSFRGSVLIRYRTGDLGTLNVDPCEHCGSTVPRIDPNIERFSEIKKIKGNLVNLNELHRAIMEQKDVNEWQLEISKKHNDPYEMDEVVLYIHPAPGTDMNNLERSLLHLFHNQWELTPRIQCINKADLIKRLGMETELKERRIIDSRPR